MSTWRKRLFIGLRTWKLAGIGVGVALILSGGAFSFLYSVFYDREQLASVPPIEAPK